MSCTCDICPSPTPSLYRTIEDGSVPFLDLYFIKASGTKNEKPSTSFMVDHRPLGPRAQSIGSSLTFESYLEEFLSGATVLKLLRTRLFGQSRSEARN